MPGVYCNIVLLDCNTNSCSHTSAVYWVNASVNKNVLTMTTLQFKVKIVFIRDNCELLLLAEAVYVQTSTIIVCS